MTAIRDRASRLRHLLQQVVELGIQPSTPLDLAIATRASNWLFAFGVLTHVMGAVGSLADAGSPLLAVECLTVALICAGCLLLSAAGLVTAARWIFLVAVAGHVFVINLALGRASGAPFFFITLLGFPVLAFAQVERRQVLFAYAFLFLVFLAADAATQAFGPLVLSSEKAGVAYYVHLLQSAALAVFGLGYYRRSMLTARIELEAARARIAELVENMLPPSIASRLEHGERLIAESHSEASVLFADLTGFSVLTNRLTPSHLVEVLNRMFSGFDEAAGRHGIEKIKTIGDCYMAATGVLDGRSRSGTDALMEFAIDVLAIVSDVAGALGLHLDARVGIATGPVVSGVIGTRRFTFDVWGDTVNLAQQMESTGVPGRVQVAEATYWRLHDRYSFEPRGQVTVKSGRQVTTYLFVSRLESALGSSSTAG